MVQHIFVLRAFFALLLLPNSPRLDCRVSSLVEFRFPYGIFSRGLATLWEALSVGPLVRPSVIIESKSRKMIALDVCVGVEVLMRIGAGRPCPSVCGDIVNARYIVK